MKRLAILIFSAAIAVWGLRLPRAAEPPADLMRLLPPETLIAIDVRDAPALLRKWDASPFARFYDDPRAASFFRPVRDQLQTLQRRLGADPARLRQFFSGQLVLAGLPASRDAKEPVEWLVLARHNGDPAVLDRLKRPPAPPGTTLRRIPGRIDGFDIIRLEVIREERAQVSMGEGSGNNRNKSEKKSKRPTLTESDLRDAQGIPAEPQVKQQVVEEYEAYYGPSLMIHAETRGRPLEKILRAIENPGTGASLTQKREFKAVRASLDGAGDLTVYVDAGKLAAEALRGDAKARQFLNLQALGLEELKGAGLSVTLQARRAEMTGTLLSPPPRRGVARLFFLPEGPAPDVAGMIPAEAIAFTAATVPLARIWDMAMETLQAVSPPIYMLVDAQLRSFEQGSGLKVRTGLVDPLGDRVARFILPGQDVSRREELATTMLALRDGASFRQTLRALLDFFAFLGGYHIETDTGGRWPVWTLAEGAPNTPGAASGRALFHLCVTDHWMLAGAHRNGIDEVIRRLERPGLPSLKDRPLYRDVTAQLPENRYATIVLDTGGLFKVAQTMLESSGLAETYRPVGTRLPHVEPGLGMVNPRRIPDARMWGEFFGPAGAAFFKEGDEMLRMRTFIEYK